MCRRSGYQPRNRAYAHPVTLCAKPYQVPQLLAAIDKLTALKAGQME
jgi:hypothetical protein